MGHETSEISPIVALVVYIVDEVNALHLYYVLKRKCPHIEYKLRRVLRNELGTLTSKLGIDCSPKYQTKPKGSSIRIQHWV